MGGALGYFILGPLLAAGVLDWAEKQEPIVRELINVESMIVNSLISSCVPMFLLWAVSFYCYSNFKPHLKNLNKTFPLLWLFAQSPSTLILFLSSMLFGICLFGWLKYEHGSSLTALTILSVFFVIIGFIVRATCTPDFKRNKFLDSYSKLLANICVILTVGAYLWSVLSDPINIYLIIEKSMENG